MKPRFQSILFPALAAGFVCLAASASAAPYTWGGATSFWTDTSVTGWDGGPPVLDVDTATINSGQVNFANHDTFGNHTTTTSASINLNGGTLASNGWFTTIWGLNLNGGTLLANGGAAPSVPAFQLGGTVTVAGSQMSTINATTEINAINQINIGGNGNPWLEFNVADATGDPSPDLSINATLQNNPFGAGGLIKTGVGTLLLSGANTYTGGTLVWGGTLNIASSGSLTNIYPLNTNSGGAMTISGTVTVADNGSFGVGAGTASDGTTGSVTVNTGGVLNIGGGGGYIAIGGRDVTGAGLGNGTLTVAGGTLNVAAPGTVSNGLDASSFWMNPYGTGGGTSTVNLDGGLISTLRTFRNGSGSSTVFNLNGGTLQAASGYIGGFFAGLSRVNVRNGGAVMDTNGNSLTVGAALLHSDIGGDNAIDGGLTKQGAGTLTLSNANTFTGKVIISDGTIVDTVQANTATPIATGLGDMTVSGRQIQINSGATLQFGNNDALGSATVLQPTAIVVNGGTMSHGNFFTTIGNVTLNGGTLTGGNGVVPTFQTFNILGTVTVGGASGSSIITTGTTNTGVHLGGNIIFDVSSTGSGPDLTVAVPLINKVANFGAGSLTKTGAGSMVLSAVNTYTGATTVSAGTLALVQPYLADSASVGISATATLDLQFGATDTVDKLFINGVQQAAGTWGADGNLAADHTSPRITGSGLLNVTTPPSVGYAGWASGFLPAFTNTAADLDFENDGLASGIEWVVGGDPTLNDAASVAPTFNNTSDPNNFLFTFRRRDTAATDPNTTIIVQYGSDLQSWTTAQDGVSGVSIDASTDLGGGFHQVTVAIPRALAPSGKLFTRLNVAVAP